MRKCGSVRDKCKTRMGGHVCRADGRFLKIIISGKT